MRQGVRTLCPGRMSAARVSWTASLKLRQGQADTDALTRNVWPKRAACAWNRDLRVQNMRQCFLALDLVGYLGGTWSRYKGFPYRPLLVQVGG